jgi:hypothetical protein
MPQHPTREPSQLALPIIDTSRRETRGGATEFVRAFDPGRDTFLIDHRIDGVPVLPMAMAVELASEAAQSCWPDLHFTGLRDFQLLKGLRFENGPMALRVVVRSLADPPYERSGTDAVIEIVSAENPTLRYYRATAELSARPTDPAPFVPRFQDPFSPFSRSARETYADWCFHGPLFHRITEISGISERSLKCKLNPSLVSAAFTGAGPGDWIVDPAVFDCGLQLSIVWSRVRHDMTPLPSRFNRYQRFASLAVAGLHCHADFVTEMGGRIIKANIWFLDAQNRVLGLLEDMEGSASKELNRLAGPAPSGIAAS